LSSNEYNIPPCDYLLRLHPHPHRLAHPALDTIPDHGPPNPPPDRETEAAVFQAIALEREH
jgi:hypothetical protein